MGELRIKKEDILNALQTVQEPDLKKDLVTLNMIKDVELGVNEVRFTVILTTPACPLKDKIKNDCIQAIHSQIDSTLNVVVTFDAQVTGRFKEALPQVKNCIAIASGKGGVGKSTVTAHLALALHRAGAKVGILDADIFGPSIPILFGVEDEKPKVIQSNGKNKIIPIEIEGIQLISMGFLVPPEGAVVWRGPMASQALRQFINDVLWHDLDYLLIDLPPGTSDIQLTLVQALQLTGAVIITTPQKVALADATKAYKMFSQNQIQVKVLGLVENMAYFTPEELPENKYYIFGKDGGKSMAEQYEIPFLGQIPLIQSIRERSDEGILTENESYFVYYQKIAENLAQQIALVNAEESLTT